MRNLASSAPHVERPQLAPTWLIAAMTVMVGLALWLIYPRQNLENRLADLPESDLTNSYLGSLLRSDPDNPHLRLLLAQRQIAHGEIAAAHDTLAPVLRHPDPALHKKALWAQWELTLAAYNATDPAERPAHLDALRAQIRELAQHRWPRPQTLRLASWASQLHEGAVALQLYASVLPDNPTEATHFYIASAEQALAQGDYFGSAHLYLQAKNTSPDATEAHALALVAVRTLQSGNQPAAALALAQTELAAWLDEPSTLVFMVELARAAGRPEIAEQYVRRLLHLQTTPHNQPMAWRGPVYDDGAQWLAPGRWRLRVANQRPAQAATTIPFDEKTYLLGYQVFLENGNAEDAWQLAHTAVAQHPQDTAWRERLAQTSEWTGRQPLALQQWLHLAQSTDQESAWQAVLRLAPGLFDNHALALALRHQLRQNPGDAALLQAFVQVQEAEGEPQVAIDFLQRQRPTPQTLETLARLAEHAGQPDLALATWRKLLAQPQQRTPARALHAALLALQHNQAEQGLAWLEAAYVQSGQPPAADAEAAAELWRITGAVAYTQEQHALALDAYRRLIASAHAQAEDFDSLIQLLLPTTPEEAAEIAHQAWQHYHQPGHLVLAWTQWSARNQWQRITQSLHALQQQPDTWASLQANPEFLRLLGTYHQNFGRLEQAQKYYEAGFALAPTSDALRQALLWLFIDSNDAVAIQRLLTVYEAQWSLSSAMHDSLAAAYQALSQPQAALQRYLTPHVAEHANDFLWGMNYADALEQNQQSDQAWRLRQHLLAQQGALGRYTRAQARARWLTQEGLDTVQRIARTRLVLTQRPGDPALDVLRELLRLDRDAQGQYSNAAAETAIGWLQDAGEYGAERGFLYQQYARSHSLRSNRPLWADITLALAEDDKASTGQLLETFDQRLPRYDRVNAAVAVGDIRLAQSAAFETQDQQTETTHCTCSSPKTCWPLAIMWACAPITNSWATSTKPPTAPCCTGPSAHACISTWVLPACNASSPATTWRKTCPKKKSFQSWRAGSAPRG